VKLAIFDLDGTITRHDSFVPYLRGFVRRHPVRAWRTWAALPAVAVFLLVDRDRGRLKQSLMRSILGGASRTDIDAWTGEFVERIIATALCPGAVRRIAAHRDARDRLVLLSASPDLYVPALARRLGFDECICTQVKWNGERLDGALASENRRGEEKARCVRAVRNRFPDAFCSAYGNGASDLPHLKDVDHAVLANGNACTRRAARALGIACEDWR
jgi:phosphatidylglycerophosphatase C